MKKTSLIAVFFLIIFNTFSYSQTIKETQDWLKLKFEMYGGQKFMGTYFNVDFPDSTSMIVYELMLDINNDIDTPNVYFIDFSSIDVDRITYKVLKKGGLILYLYGSCKMVGNIEISDIIDNTSDITISTNGEIDLYFKPSDNPTDLGNRILKAIKHYNHLLVGNIDDTF